MLKKDNNYNNPLSGSNAVIHFDSLDLLIIVLVWFALFIGFTGFFRLPSNRSAESIGDYEVVVGEIISGDRREH